jgi:hypothetical protein
MRAGPSKERPGAGAEEEEEEAATGVDESTIKRGVWCGKSSIASLGARLGPCAAITDPEEGTRTEEEEEKDEEEEEEGVDEEFF